MGRARPRVLGPVDGTERVADAPRYDPLRMVAEAQAQVSVLRRALSAGHHRPLAVAAPSAPDSCVADTSKQEPIEVELNHAGRGAEQCESRIRIVVLARSTGGVSMANPNCP